MKRKITLCILAIVITILICIGITYAYFSANVALNNQTETVIKSNELTLTFNGTSEINCSNLIPGESCTKTFNVKNDSNRAVTYNIYMQNITNEFNEDLVYTLTDETGVVVAETKAPATNTEKTYILSDIEIGATSTKNYTLKVEFKYLATPQNDNQGASFKATVGIDANKVDSSNNDSVACASSENLLYDKVKSLSLGNSDLIDFNLSSHYSANNGLESPGVYQFAEDNDVYFYRGKVDNNIVFGGFCWKIIRTTSTGGTKLLYSGIAKDGKYCNNTEGDLVAFYDKYSSQVTSASSYDIKYIGYTVEDENGNQVDSIAKTKIEEWYENNLKDNYGEYLEDTIYCNDRTRAEYSDTTIGDPAWKNGVFFNTTIRSSYLSINIEPSLVCTQKEDSYTVGTDKGNGLLKYPIALMTSDEFALAGATTTYKASGVTKDSEYYNNSYYLYYYNSGHSMWSMSPLGSYGTGSGYTPYMNVIQTDGYINIKQYNSEADFRPVISLNNCAQLDGNGNGTGSNPYVVITN